MKFSESWLRELIDIPVNTVVLTEQLTMAGLEVEAVTTSQGTFSNVIVANVTSIQSHPDSDHLVICKLDIGNNDLKTVICGADNIIEDKCYPYAKPGATLAAEMRVEKKTIKGVVSEGMLCSVKELGLAESAIGIYQLGDDAKPGQDLQDYLALDDNSIELSLTPNRGDCLSLIGIAREVAVLNKMNLTVPDISPVPHKISSKRDINILAPEACPRYCGRIIEGLNASVSTPSWISEKLMRCDVRSINVVVDLTNYVMLELGQPMHAFDSKKLNGDIDIRMANQGEKLTLLDDTTHVLSSNTLVIADKSGAIAMAGIMGGKSTMVNPDTHTLFLESAFFSPVAIMGRARQYGLHTDASHRFERGVDPELALAGLERLTGLLIEICGGKAGPVVHARENTYLPQTVSILLRPSRIKKLLGISIPKSRVEEILRQLGFEVSWKDKNWHITVPSYRFDICIEADLIEEIARIYGYGRIPGTLPKIEMNMGVAGDDQLGNETMSRVLATLGYHEVITYSFVDPKLQSLLLAGDTGVELINPISTEMSVMRKSLWPGLVSVLLHNIKRQQSRVRLFETGHVFYPGKVGSEKSLLSGLCYGNLYPEQWDIKHISSDFYDLKSDIESILMPFLDTKSLRYGKLAHNALDERQSAEIVHKNNVVGIMGALNPRILGGFDLQRPVWLFELDLSGISAKKHIKYAKFSKYPSIRRDISIIIDEKISVFEVMEHVKSVDKTLLKNLELFDVYMGEGIDLGKKSLALGLTFQRSSSTLTDNEADIVVNNILHSLQHQFGAILRE